MRNSITHVLDMLVYLLDARAETVSGYINGKNDAVDALNGESVDDAGGGGYVVMDNGTFTTIDCTVARDVSSMALTFIGDEGKLYLNNDDGEWRYWDLEDGTHVEHNMPGIDGAWTWNEDYENAFPRRRPPHCRPPRRRCRERLARYRSRMLTRDYRRILHLLLYGVARVYPP